MHTHRHHPVRLVLEDGTILTGRGFGCIRPSGESSHPITVTGEVVFNTAMTGYQEALTDPSYSGQILTMTAPLIGNYGVNLDDVESTRVQVAAFVVRELSRIHSNYRATTDLSSWLEDQGVLGIEGIDTRALTRRLRIDGAMRGILSADDTLSDMDLLEAARSAPLMSGRNLVQDVSRKEPDAWSTDLGDWAGHQATSSTDSVLRVVALDCGAKHNILRHLKNRGCDVTVVPHDVSADAIRELNPDGLFVSNGPGDPATVESTIATLRTVAGEIPTFGICLGHQLLCLAIGGTTFKLKFGHRGANQPVKNLLTGRVEITSQNHGFAVDPESIKAAGAEPTHIHLNDSTLAGFRHLTKPIFAVQYHPEASPGPHDAAYLFDCFVHMMRTKAPLDAATMAAVQM